jgi:hypothetical protein
MFALPLVADKQIDFWQAMELSRKTVAKHWFKLFGFALTSILVIFLGFMALGFGVFVASPLVVAMLMYAYEDIFGGILPAADIPPAAVSPSGTLIMSKKPPVMPHPAGMILTPAARIGLAALVLVIGIIFVASYSRHDASTHMPFFHRNSVYVPPEPPITPIELTDNSDTNSSESLSPEARDKAREALNDRLEAALNVNSDSEKDEILSELAVSAAKSGELEILNKTLEQMANESNRDDATRRAALVLRRKDLRKPAIELAKRIGNGALRDQTLSELAR